MDGAISRPAPAHVEPSAKVFWPMFVIGWALMAFGLVGLVNSRFNIALYDFARWTVGLAILHDLVLAPIAIAIASLVLVRIRPPYRAVIQGALIISALVVAFSWPFLRGYGERPDDPSSLPRDYAAGLTTVLVVVWSSAAALSVRAGLQARRSPPASPPTGFDSLQIGKEPAKRSREEAP